jgi:MoaA/NifB/PqqE/SkfB family radical SAM enzyme
MAYLQVTDKCNMSCEHCGFSCTTEGEFMPMAIYEKTLEFFHRNCDYITIGGGEPTLHPDILKMVLLAMAQPWMEVPVFMVTNGSNTKISLVLANLTKNAKDAFSCRLSVDQFHDPVDDEVYTAFEGLHNTVNRVLPTGRALETGVYTEKVGFSYLTHRENQAFACFCDDFVVKPNGDVYYCGCSDSPLLGNIMKERDCVYIESIMRSGEDHSCWKTSKRWTRRYKRLYTMAS